MASDTESKNCEEKLPKLVIRLTRLDNQIVRRSPRPKKPPSRYSCYEDIVSSPARVKKSNSVSSNEGRRKSTRLSSLVSSDIGKKLRDRHVFKIDREEESSDESGEENRPNLVTRRRKKILKIVESDDEEEEEDRKKDIARERRKRVSVALSVKDSDSDVTRKLRDRDLSKIHRVEESSDESGEENRPNLATRRRKKVSKIEEYDDNDNVEEEDKKIDGTKERRKRVSVASSVKDSVLNDNELFETPRKSKRAASSRSQRDQDLGETEPPLTPKKNVLTPNAKTPSSAISKGLLTPSMQRRNIRVFKPVTPLQNARAHLHVSSVPKSLPCREEEFNNIYMFLEGKLMDDVGGCLYISGVPGTGKTATVNEAINCLKRSVKKGKFRDFNYVEINGMKLTEPRQAYVEILKQLMGRKATWEQAYRLLDKKFNSSTATKTPMTLLLVDELDLLCNKRQDVVYNLLDWPAKSGSNLVVITIANTMDLPEKVLMLRVTSRLGLTRLTFQPYTYKQLQEIVEARLKDSEAFKSEAIQLVARKVAAVSGDARRALDICRRATELAEINDSEFVSMTDVVKALNEMIASPKVQAIKHCSEIEKMFLQAVSFEVNRTGVEEVNFKSVYGQLYSICSFEGIKEPTVTEAITICSRLGASRLLICEHSRKDIYQRILLNVSSDDIHFAIKNIEI